MKYASDLLKVKNSSLEDMAKLALRNAGTQEMDCTDMSMNPKMLEAAKKYLLTQLVIKAYGDIKAMPEDDVEAEIGLISSGNGKKIIQYLDEQIASAKLQPQLKYVASSR